MVRLGKNMSRLPYRLHHCSAESMREFVLDESEDTKILTVFTHESVDRHHGDCARPESVELAVQDSL